MKIIIAHYKYYIQGGPERYLLKFMELAEKHGCEIIPFSVKFPNNMETKYADYFVSSSDNTGNFNFSNHNLTYLIEGASREFHNREAYKKLKKLIKDEKPDMIYVLIPGQLSSDIFKAAKEEDIPIILRLSDFRLLCGNNVMLRNENICEECIYGKYVCMLKHRCVKGSFVLSALRMLSLYYNRVFNRYRYIDAVIVPPAFTGNKLVESGYFPEEKVYVNPTFLDCSNIVSPTKNSNYVLCLGRFSPEKGFVYVIEAMKYLRDIPVSVVVTGNREQCDAQLQTVIKENDLEDKVHFAGFLHGEELENLTASALCVACPAIWYENLPNVVLEAYSYGKPVIASNLGSLAEAVEDERTGLLFEAKNSRQIANCIRRLFENPDFCQQLGKNARTKCETVYSPKEHWKNFMDIYRKVNEKRKDR